MQPLSTVPTFVTGSNLCQRVQPFSTGPATASGPVGAWPVAETAPSAARPPSCRFALNKRQAANAGTPLPPRGCKPVAALHCSAPLGRSTSSHVTPGQPHGSLWLHVLIFERLEATWVDEARTINLDGPSPDPLKTNGQRGNQIHFF